MVKLRYEMAIHPDESFMHNLCSDMIEIQILIIMNIPVMEVEKYKCKGIVTMILVLVSNLKQSFPIQVCDELFIKDTHNNQITSHNNLSTQDLVSCYKLPTMILMLFLVVSICLISLYSFSIEIIISISVMMLLRMWHRFHCY